MTCLEPGASVSRIALSHGVNANLLRKWIQKHKETQKEPLKHPQPCASAFIPVRIAPSAEDMVLEHERTGALDLRADHRVTPLREPDRPVLLSCLAKVNVTLPNGVKLTVECGDVGVVTAIIGAVCDVQTGR